MTYLIVFLSGILTALPLMFDFLVFLPWFSMIPLFYIAEKKKSAYRHGLVFSLGYYGVVYYWFTYLYPMDFVGFSNTVSVLVIIVAWLGLSLLQGIGTAFVPFVYRRLYSGKREYLAPITAAALWCVMEWLQNFFWFGVPWARLAVTQYKVLPIIQSASLFGSLFIGFLIVTVNGLLLVAFKRFRETKKLHVTAAVAVGLALLNIIYGFARLGVRENRENSEKLVAAAIQGNIASGDKWADDSHATSLRIYTELTEKAVTESGARLVVWPETVINAVSLNGSYSSAAETREYISKLAKRLDAYIAVGSFYFDSKTEESFNSIFLFQPDGTVNENVYHKRHLVPFGEYLPMPNVINTLLPFLGEMNLFDGSITPGNSSELFETEDGVFGALVCFDSIYEELTRVSVNDGAELILLSTNDSWYLDSAAVWQHNGHAVLRAVENGRCFVRAANTGVSSIISENGRIKSYLSPLVDGYTAGEVTLNSDKTLYSYVGDIIAVLSLIYLFALGGVTLRELFKKAPCDKDAILLGETS